MIREGGNHSDEAPISSGAFGCTFSSTKYPAEIDGQRYMFWDTAGLNEGMHGTVTPQESVKNLGKLLQTLDHGIHLLVYCIRGKRFRQVIKDNYDLFYREICRSQVPIVLVVTGLETEVPDMECWWRENGGVLSAYGLHFRDHACITATRGKKMENGRHLFDEEYLESRAKMRRLLTEPRNFIVETSEVPGGGLTQRPESFDRPASGGARHLHLRSWILEVFQTIQRYFGIVNEVRTVSQ
jgi:hypothetical protein